MNARQIRRRKRNARAVAALVGVGMVAVFGVGLTHLGEEAAQAPKPDVTNTQVSTSTTVPTLPIGTTEDRASLPTQTRRELGACQQSMTCQVEPKPDHSVEVIGSTTTTSITQPVVVPGTLPNGASADNPQAGHNVDTGAMEGFTP
jgi:hypothetical protein